MSSDLIRAIDRLVEEKTFNLDALEAIKELRDKAAALEDQVDDLIKRTDRLRGEVREHEKSISEKNDRIEKQNTKILELEAREKQAFEAIYKAEMHSAVAEAYKDALRTVFRPHSVRETIARSFPIATTYANGNGGHTQTVQSYDQTDRIDREDT
jgi:septal ring factor EnvC (AmiA/AmiB activator)